MIESILYKWYEITAWWQVQINSDPILLYFSEWSVAIYDIVFLIGLCIAIISVLIYAFGNKKDKGLYIRETITNMFTLAPFYVTEIFFGALAIAVYFLIYWNISWHLPINTTMFLITILAADLIYFIEHYYAHVIRIFWWAHSVHHSSPIMNISVAYRFSIFDPIIGFLFHIPLILLGFHPAFVFGAEILVQAYQFWIHTEKIKRMWPLEGILNTPAAHRVHHWSNPKYIDKNFWWITVIWDRLFWTYQDEEEPVMYWLTKQIGTSNPFTVQFFELWRIFWDIWKRKWVFNKLKTLYKGPGWKPDNEL